VVLLKRADLFVEKPVPRAALPWQGVVLASLSAVDTALWLLAVLFVAKLGYEGFAAGEMGIMVGMFGVLWLFFMLPVLALKAVVTVYIIRCRRWSVVAALVISGVSIPAGVLSLAVGPEVFAGVMLFLGLMLWAEICCLKHPRFSGKSR
jgi:hypothetical protein